MLKCSDPPSDKPIPESTMPFIPHPLRHFPHCSRLQLEFLIMLNSALSIYDPNETLSDPPTSLSFTPLQVYLHE